MAHARSTSRRSIYLCSPAARRRTLALLGALPAALAVGTAGPASAIQPRTFEHQTEADFEPGGLDGVVVTAGGQVKLAPRFDEAVGLPESASAVYDAVAIGDAVYLALGPSGALAKVGPEGDAELLVELDAGQPFALAPYADGLIAACAPGGEDGAVALVAISLEGGVETLAELPGVPYVWSIAPQGDGSLILGVGQTGRVIRWSPPPETAEAPDEQDAEDTPETDAFEVLLETEQEHVLAVAQGPEGVLYAGTSDGGLVYRLTPNDAGGYDAFVVLDAAEPEIAALLVGPDGTLYAGSTDAEEAKPGRLEEANDIAIGQADSDSDEGDGEEDPGDDPGEGPGGDLPAPVEPPVEPGPEPVDAVDQVEDQAAQAEPPAPAEDLEPADEAATEDAASDADAEDPQAQDANEEQAAADVAVAETAADSPGAGAPTPEMRDRLRELLRKRLEASRKSGALAQGGLDAADDDEDRPRGRPARSSESKSGNAVYAVDPLGFVTEVFRESVAIYDLALTDDGQLIAATGVEGQVYRIDPATGETAVLGDLDAKQAAALALTADGPVVGTAQPAGAFRLDPRPAANGTYISPVLDADRVSLWGQARLTATLPGQSEVLVETRSGNVADPDAGPWSQWSKARSFGPDPERGEFDPLTFPVDAPPARYLQYRLTLIADPGDGLGDGPDAEPGGPAVDSIRLAHISPNQGPAIESLTAEYPDLEDDPDAERNAEIDFEWETSDPDDDRLRYTLAFRAAGSDKFVTLAQDLDEDSYSWDTRRAPDGRYVVRLTATDAPDNPPDMAQTRRRVSDPVVVDNTPPAISGLKVEVRGRTAVVSADLTDALSTIESIAYAVDDDEDFRTALPEDLLLDSTSERWSVTLRGLARGAHVVTLRVRDARGNVARAAVPFTIE
ncbi:MAG: hypothetical protein AAF288_07435 [Planctomycetota bacterium]